MLEVLAMRTSGESECGSVKNLATKLSADRWCRPVIIPQTTVCKLKVLRRSAAATQYTSNMATGDYRLQNDATGNPCACCLRTTASGRHWRHFRLGGHVVTSLRRRKLAVIVSGVGASSLVAAAAAELTVACGMRICVWSAAQPLQLIHGDLPHFNLQIHE